MELFFKTTGTRVVSLGPSPHEIVPSSLNSRRKAADTFSMSMMIINFKKFKSIHFSLKFEVCKGTWKEGMENAQLAGRVLVVTSFPIM